MIKKGTIAVRTGGYFTDTDICGNASYDKTVPKDRHIGVIFEAYKDSTDDYIYYAESYSPPRNFVRLATQSEINAYHRGIRHIDDIKDADIPSSSILDDFLASGQYGGNDALDVYLKYFKPLNYLNVNQGSLERNILDFKKFNWSSKGSSKRAHSGFYDGYKSYSKQKIEGMFDRIKSKALKDCVSVTEPSPLPQEPLTSPEIEEKPFVKGNTYKVKSRLNVDIDNLL